MRRRVRRVRSLGVAREGAEQKVGDGVPRVLRPERSARGRARAERDVASVAHARVLGLEGVDVQRAELPCVPAPDLRQIVTQLPVARVDDVRQPVAADGRVALNGDLRDFVQTVLGEQLGEVDAVGRARDLRLVLIADRLIVALP